jgi:hypothetical protein
MLFPGVDGHIKRAQTLALSIARKAPMPAISHLAMQAVSEAAALRPGSLPIRADGGKWSDLLSKLRAALEELKSPSAGG